jgi:hypothetical protein
VGVGGWEWWGGGGDNYTQSVETISTYIQIKAGNKILRILYNGKYALLTMADSRQC